MVTPRLTPRVHKTLLSGACGLRKAADLSHAHQHACLPEASRWVDEAALRFAKTHEPTLCGLDSFAATSRAVGVASSLDGWERHGVDSAALPRALMEHIAHAERARDGHALPLEQLTRALAATSPLPGSSSLLLATLSADYTRLQFAALGTPRAMVLRCGVVVADSHASPATLLGEGVTSPPTTPSLSFARRWFARLEVDLPEPRAQHVLRAPSSSGDEEEMAAVELDYRGYGLEDGTIEAKGVRLSDARCFDFDVQEGDVVIAATHGVWNNLCNTPRKASLLRSEVERLLADFVSVGDRRLVRRRRRTEQRTTSAREERDAIEAYAEGAARRCVEEAYANFREPDHMACVVTRVEAVDTVGADAGEGVGGGG